MTTRIITSHEIAAKQQSIITDYRQSQTSVSLAGFRHLVGNTFIALGERVYGCVEQRRAPVQPTAAAPARGL